ncbi:hypothetical protein BB561_001618 [Smittium simulii]|uniref:Uncharacterized protein n=1 Tax=Smittium simulii TaxID=133385 RepID=A0A2T9YTZ5_9FUNG|nr:hypothetical protein BB561_003078 [Smittium simulii]PVU95776.1 hypothetical protein BB561_001618 [Smittium simulii]
MDDTVFMISDNEGGVFSNMVDDFNKLEQLNQILISDIKLNEQFLESNDSLTQDRKDLHGIIPPKPQESQVINSDSSETNSNDFKDTNEKTRKINHNSKFLKKKNIDNLLNEGEKSNIAKFENKSNSVLNKSEKNPSQVKNAKSTAADNSSDFAREAKKLSIFQKWKAKKKLSYNEMGNIKLDYVLPDLSSNALSGKISVQRSKKTPKSNDFNENKYTNQSNDLEKNGLNSSKLLDNMNANELVDNGLHSLSELDSKNLKDFEHIDNKINQDVNSDNLDKSTGTSDNLFKDSSSDFFQKSQDSAPVKRKSIYSINIINKDKSDNGDTTFINRGTVHPDFSNSSISEENKSVVVSEPQKLSNMIIKTLEWFVDVNTTNSANKESDAFNNYEVDYTTNVITYKEPKLTAIKNPILGNNTKELLGLFSSENNKNQDSDVTKEKTNNGSIVDNLSRNGVLSGVDKKMSSSFSERNSFDSHMSILSYTMHNLPETENLSEYTPSNLDFKVFTDIDSINSQAISTPLTTGINSSAKNQISGEEIHFGNRVRINSRNNDISSQAILTNNKPDNINSMFFNSEPSELLNRYNSPSSLNARNKNKVFYKKQSISSNPSGSRQEKELFKSNVVKIHELPKLFK